MSNINEKENNDGSINSINTTAVDSNGNGDLAATDTTTVNGNGNGSLGATDTPDTTTTTTQSSGQTVRFERMSNGTCDLTFTPTPTTTTTTANNTSKVVTDTTTPTTTNNTSKVATDTTTTQPNNVSIPNVSFPYVFNPSEHGFDDIYGSYVFDCCGCIYSIEVEAPTTTTTTTTKDVTTTTTTEDVTTTTTTEDVTTTTTTEDVTTTTTTEDVTTTTTTLSCNSGCVEVKVTRTLSSDLTIDYVNCNGDDQTLSFTPKTVVKYVCICEGSMTTKVGYSIELTNGQCTDGLPTFDCDKVGLNVEDGVAGESVVFTTDLNGQLIPGGISPSTYSTNVSTYTYSILVPSGYTNSGETLACSDNNVVVTSGGGDDLGTCYRVTTISSGSVNSVELQRTLPGAGLSYFNFSQRIGEVDIDNENIQYFTVCSTYNPSGIRNSGGGDLRDINVSDGISIQQLRTSCLTDLSCDDVRDTPPYYKVRHCDTGTLFNYTHSSNNLVVGMTLKKTSDGDCYEVIQVNPLMNEDLNLNVEDTNGTLYNSCAMCKKNMGIS